jgi:hypothetical protein
MGDIVPVLGEQFEETLASVSGGSAGDAPGVRQRMMDADVEVCCDAGYGEVTPDRMNSRNRRLPKAKLAPD